jgi:primase-polymerase (primpol)-like protein
MREYDQWVNWAWLLRDGKWTKVPINPRTGSTAAADNPATWGTFAQAVHAYHTGGLAGLGFVFTPEDPFAGVDLDDCYDPATHTLTPQAALIVAELDSYTEISPRGRGVKVLVRACVPGGKGRRDARRGIEIYDRGRYFTLTGVRL